MSADGREMSDASSWPPGHVNATNPSSRQFPTVARTRTASNDAPPPSTSFSLPRQGQPLAPGGPGGKGPYTPEELAQIQMMRRHMQQQEAQRRQQQLQQQQQQQQRELTDEEELQLELKYGADQVTALILPVSLCMLVVIATIRSVNYYATNDTQFAYSPYKESSADNSGERFGGALLNVVIIIGIIVFMTMLLVIFYKYRCYKAIHGWLILSSMLLLFFFSYQFIIQVLSANNVTMDYVTMCIAIWNFGWVGLLVIHWRGPLLLQQAYLIAVSALMALVLIKNLPDWTTWVLLGAIALYDLVAVLCPRGPLRMLVELAQEREEPLFPALVYSSTMVWIVGMADRSSPPPYSDPPATSRAAAPAPAAGSTSSASSPAGPNTAASTRQPGGARGPDSRSHAGTGPQSSPASSSRPRAPPLLVQPSDGFVGGPTSSSTTPAVTPAASTSALPAISAEEEAERKGVKLGLGDFIFYSVLVGKAATVDWGTIFVCYVAILIGLAATLLLLSILKHALPALPISIMLGLIFFFITNLLLNPFLDALSVNQVFV